MHGWQGSNQTQKKKFTIMNYYQVWVNGQGSNYSLSAMVGAGVQKQDLKEQLN